MNYGLKIPKIETKEEGAEHILGSSKLKGQVINPSGDWRPYLPEKEPQFKLGVETNACTVYGTLNAIETLIRFETGIQVNYSDRYLANVARKEGKLDPFSGADPHQIAEIIRTIAGCLRENRLPWTDDIKETNDYYLVKELTELMQEGKRWYDEWDFNHEWVFRGGTPQEKRAKLEEALTKGTVCVSVFAWKYQNDKKWYYKDEGDQDGHWTNLPAAKDKYYVFDSYDGFEKQLDPLYDFQIAKVYYLTPAGEKLNILQHIVNILAQIIGLQAIFVQKKTEKVIPIDVPPPPPVPPLILEPKENIKAMILRVCDEEKLTPQMKERLFKTIRCETAGTFDPKIVGKPNKNGTRDWGLCQFNDGKNDKGVPYWIGKGAVFASTDEVLNNPEKCVRVMCREWKLGHQHYWVCYKKLFPNA